MSKKHPDGDQSWTAEDFKKARPLAKARPDIVKAMKDLQKAKSDGLLEAKNSDEGLVVIKKRGRPKIDKPRINKTLRLSADLVRAMESSGRYSERVEKALTREFLGR